MVTSAIRRRRLLAVVAVGSAVLVLGAGFLAGRLVRSPAQRAADAAGPGPTLLTVPVESRVLTAQVVTRGDVGAGTQTVIGAPAGAAVVVTRLAAGAGQEIRQGQVLAELSGRPVFALAGPTPAYRDLRPGYKGDDVRQLQQDLADMGFDPGAIDGVFGDPTKTAVRAFYQSIGYEALPAGESDDQMLRDSQAAAQQAQWAVDDAQDALDTALAAADKARAAAAAGAATEAGASPAAAGADAQAAREAAVDQAEATVKTDQKALDRARQQLSQARASQADVAAKTGPVVPLGEYSFIPSFPARVAAVAATVGAAPPTPWLTLASGALQATGTVNPGQAGLVRQGQPVAVLLEAGGVQAGGTVSQITPITGNDPAAGSSRVVVTPTGEWPQGFWGQNVRLTIDGGSTGGEALVVPVSALFASADGSTRVTVVAAGGGETDVTVTVGVTANGYAAVTPLSGRLAAGDQVAVSAANAQGGG